MKNLVLASLGSLTLVGAASAAPTGLYWEFESVGDWCVGRLYICFDQPNNVLLNVFNANIGLTGANGFNHNDVTTNGANALSSAASSWNPNQFFPPLFGNPAIDSYLTIGGSTSTVIANANTTAFDPSFSTNGTVNSLKGGWFNSNPPNLQGKTVELPGQPGWYTLIGQFVVHADFAETARLDVVLAQTANSGLGTPTFPQTVFSGNFGWTSGPVPAPGALALLGLAGLAGGRRRRA